MKRLVLFSSPKGKDFEKVLENIFPADLHNKVFAYMPTHKKYIDESFTDYWREIARKHSAEFRHIDLSKEDIESEKTRLLSANILLITGGNTFWLMDKLRKTGLFETIKEFAKKEEFVISGWSAGAMVLTPTIAIAGLPHRDGSKTLMDKNVAYVEDLTGLNFVNFEIFPHYDETSQKQTLENYKKETKNEVKALTDDEYVVIGL